MAKKEEITKDQVTKDQVVKEEVVEKKTQRQERAQMNMNEEVPCRNISNCSVFFDSKKTGASYVWRNTDDVEYVSVGELVNMKSSAGRILTEPWLVVEDDEVAKFLGLDKVYENLVTPEEIAEFFKLPVNEMEHRLSKAPKGTRNLIAEKASELVAEKASCPLSGQQIHIIEQALNIDLSFVK